MKKMVRNFFVMSALIMARADYGDDMSIQILPIEYF
jgi:hypothetical protein